MDYYRKIIPIINKKKVYITIFEILTGDSGLVFGNSLSTTRAGARLGVPISGCTLFISSVATLITNEYFSKPKKRYTKQKEWIKTVKILAEKYLSKSMIDKKTDEIEEKLKTIYNHYLD